jgi:hypothetical protein
MESPVKITFNIDSVLPEVHHFGFGKATVLAASIIAGISFWIMAAAMLFDPSYR